MSPNSSTADSASRVAGVYAQSHIENAPPVKLVRLLYQGAIRFLDTAATCDPSQANSKFNYWLGRAEEVVVELRLGLDPSHAPEIAEGLTDLYLFIETSIASARNERNAAPLAGARSVLTTLLEAWTAIDTGKV